MEEDAPRSLALQYDIYVSNVLKFLDSTIERDYILKLKVIDELMYKINESEADKKTIKKALEAAQEECSKLSYKLKTSARLFDEIQGEKDKLKFEKETLESQLEQLYNVFKKPTSADKSQTHDLNSNEKKRQTLNTTEALLSDLSYSRLEDSAENVIKNSIPNMLANKRSSCNVLNDNNIKTCEMRNVNISGKQIISTTTLTMNADSVNATSVIKTISVPTSKDSLLTSSSGSAESIYSSETEKEVKSLNNFDENNEKEHNFIQKLIVVPEICGQCYKKVKFNNYMIKCLDCQTIAHLECKDRIPVVCKFGRNKGYGLKSHSTPTQKLGSPYHLLSTEKKRRKIGSPQKRKAAKKVNFSD